MFFSINFLSFFNEKNIQKVSEKNNQFKESPLVSVIMPVYNRENSVNSSIQSIFDQTYTNWELIVIDDRSTDKTSDIINKYNDKNNKVKYLLNKNKKGPAGARNYGINRSNGEYIAFLDSDDLWLPMHLEECIEILENERMKFCTAKWYVKSKGIIEPTPHIKDIYSIISRFYKNSSDKKYYKFGTSICEYILLRHLYPYHISTLVARKDSIELVGKFDEELIGHEDTLLLISLLLNYGLCIVNSYHSIYVQGEDNIHFFKSSNLRDNDEVLNKTITNRLGYIKLIKKQKKLFKHNKEKLNYSRKLIHLRQYDLLRTYQYLTYIYPKNIYRVLLWLKSTFYLFKVPKYIFRAFSFSWLNRKRPRVLIEGIDRSTLYEVIFNNKLSSDDNEVLKKIISSRGKNYWLYFERDVQIKQQERGAILFNTLTGKKLFFRKMDHFIRKVQNSKYLIINSSELENKRLRNFLIKIEKKHFGGLVDVTNNKGVPIELFVKHKMNLFWV